MDSYAPYALMHPEQIKFVAVCEPDNEKRQLFRDVFYIPSKMCFNGYEDFLKLPKIADTALICSQDRMHFVPTMELLKKGYHILLEKPMSPDMKECILMEREAKKQDRILMVCHVLRYTCFFRKIKKILDSGKIGQLISIAHNENVGYFHHAHSFVRGSWRNSEETSPMILAKCCHDMDILYWLAGAKCKNISSFGELTHFKAENAPEGAPKRCLYGCPHEKTCVYYAPKQYLTDNIGWPTSVISVDKSYKAREKALKKGPYGRCVYHCDNNVVDHQVVNMEFENSVTAAFTMSAFTEECTRTIKLMGTKGEIHGAMEKNSIEILYFDKKKENEHVGIAETESGHGGGDFGIMKDFISLVNGDISSSNLSLASDSVHSHLMALAAEKARCEKCVLNINEFKDLYN